MREVVELLESMQFLFVNIAEQTSPIVKVAMLNAYCKDYHNGEYLYDVLGLALDPFITFGVIAKPDKATADKPRRGSLLGAATNKHTDTWDSLMKFFHKLRCREVTGGLARLACHEVFEELRGSPKSQTLIANILAKDVRCGLGVKTVNKAKIFGREGKLLRIRDFRVMLAEQGKIKDVFFGELLYVEPKIDGMRCIVRISNTDIAAYSRSGKTITLQPEIKEELTILGKTYNPYDCKSVCYYLDGELYGHDWASSISGAKKKGSTEKIEFNVFDILCAHEFEVRDDKKPTTHALPYYKRRKILTEMFKKNIVLKSVVLVPSEAVAGPNYLNAFHTTAIKAGYEGTVVKAGFALYEHRRSSAWIKIKDMHSVDVPVIAMNEGTGKYEGSLGALVIEHKKVQTEVGTGFDDETRKKFWKNKKSVIGHVVEVSYQDITPDGKLRFPVFIKLRPDKDEE